MNNKYDADVIVMGGGPAGSTTSCVLAQQGHSVLLLEKEKFPREHVGESLLPFCYDIFKRIGVLDQMKGSFVRKPGVRFASPDNSYSTYWCFDHVLHDESYLSFQVKRSEFDQILLENARSKGVVVREETRATAVDLEGAEAGVLVRANGSDGGEREYRARFLVDATGRSGFLSNKRGQRKPHAGLARTAIWSHFSGIRELSGGLEEGTSIIMYLGGDRKGWMWIFPLGPDTVTLGVVMDNAGFQAAKEAVQKDGGEDWKADLFRAEIQKTEFTRELTAGAELTMAPRVEGDYSYFSEEKFGANFALVGDASRFIDPIFSSGVYLSMKSGTLLGDALHQILQHPEEHGVGKGPLVQVYDLINRAYDVVYKLIRLYYDPHAVNFAAAGSVLARDSADALAAGHYILAGDFFENSAKYEELFDLIGRDQKMFEGYKNLVINREDFYSKTCRRDESLDLLFPAGTRKQRTTNTV